MNKIIERHRDRLIGWALIAVADGVFGALVVWFIAEYIYRSK